MDVVVICYLLTDHPTYQGLKTTSMYLFSLGLGQETYLANQMLDQGALAQLALIVLTLLQ